MSFSDTKICSCECHKQCEMVRHMLPCCQFTYVKYISSDGIIDTKKYEDLVKNTSKKEK